ARSDPRRSACLRTQARSPEQCPPDAFRSALRRPNAQSPDRKTASPLATTDVSIDRRHPTRRAGKNQNGGMKGIVIPSLVLRLRRQISHGSDAEEHGRNAGASGPLSLAFFRVLPCFFRG